MKTNAKHTPGPWQEYNSQGAAMFKNWRVWNGATSICKIDECAHPETEHANARLIAAAPELLSACQSALRVFEAWQNDANPHRDLKRGESADYDAACDMVTMMREVIHNAKEAK